MMGPSSYAGRGPRFPFFYLLKWAFFSENPMKKILLLLLLTPAVHGEDATARLSAAEQEKIWQEAQAATACFPPCAGDYPRALALYQQLAAGGHAKAMSEMGQMYLEGRGVAQDYAKAKEWYEKAGAAGNGFGYTMIGAIYQDGEGGPDFKQNFAQAKEWYEKALAAGDRTAYSSIGELYQKGGPGLERDYAAAKRWYEQSIAAGNRDDYWSLANLYREGGPGLERNWATACRYYGKAEFDWQKEEARAVCSH